MGVFARIMIILGGFVLMTTPTLSAETVPADLDLVLVAPEHTTVLAENDRVRVLKFTAKAGDRIPRHAHPSMVVYVLKKGLRRFTNEDGKTVDSDPQVGDVILRDPIVHTEEVMEDFEAILVEIKK